MRLIINGLTTGDTQPYIITDFKSSVLGGVENATQPIPQTNKVHFISNYARNILWEVQMRILASSHEQLVGYIQDLTKALYPKPNTLLTLSYYTDSLSDIYTAKGYLVTDITVTREVTMATVTFSLLIPSGEIYKGNLNSITLEQTGVASGAVLPWTLPILLGTVSGAGTLNNAGNGYATIDIQIIGPGEGFTIINQTTGDSFKIDGLTLTAGQIIEVFGSTQTVTQQGVSIYQYVTSDSTFITLASGNNNLALYVDSGATLDTKAIITWYNTYVGI